MFTIVAPPELPLGFSSLVALDFLRLTSFKMSFRDTNPGHDAVANSNFTDAFRNILRVGGGWGNVRSAVPPPSIPLHAMAGRAVVKDKSRQCKFGSVMLMLTCS